MATPQDTIPMYDELRKAERYAEFIIANNVKTIYVYPLDGKERTTKNTVARHFYGRLGLRCGYARTLKQEHVNLRNAAVACGYTLIDWEPEYEQVD